MNLYYVERKEYDLEWGEYSKEKKNIVAVTEFLRDCENIKQANIITSPFGYDKKSAELLKKLLHIEGEIQEADWLIFGVSEGKIKEALDDIVGGDKDVIVVACVAMIAVLKRIAKNKNSSFLFQKIIISTWKMP